MNPDGTPPSERYSLWLPVKLFMGLAGAFALLLLLFPAAFLRFSRVMPQNFAYLTREALKAGDVKQAESIARARIEKEFYDFDAHYLLAEALAKASKPLEAAEVMRTALQKIRSLRSNPRLPAKTGYSGYDEALTYELLAVYLWDAGRYQDGAEMFRAAIDAGSSTAFEEMRERILSAIHTNPDATRLSSAGLMALRMRDASMFGTCVSALLQGKGDDVSLGECLRALWLEEADHDTTGAIRTLRSAIARVPGNAILQIALADTLRRSGETSESAALIADMRTSGKARPVNLTQFTLPNGTAVSSESLRISRNATVRSRVDTGMFRADKIIVRAVGRRAFGQAPILVFRNNETEIARAYLDGLQPTWRLFGAFPDGAPKTLSLSIEFTNDAYDPITQADRDVAILDILFL